MEKENNNKRTLEQLNFVDECKEAEDMFKPLSYAKKKQQPKKKKKQMTLMAGLKNQAPKNFQGFPMDKCILDPVLNLSVFVPPAKYGSLTRKFFRSSPEGTPPKYNVRCPHCFLVPCSSLEYEREMYAVCVDPFVNDVPGLLHHMRTRYRWLLAKYIGKHYVLKRMSSNDCIPQCATRFTQKLAEDEILSRKAIEEADNKVVLDTTDDDEAESLFISIE